MEAKYQPENKDINRTEEPTVKNNGRRSSMKDPFSLLLSNMSDSELNETFCPICNEKKRRLLFREREFPVWKCRLCGHMYISPRPSEKVVAGFYETDYMAQADENIEERIRTSPYNAVACAIAKYMPNRGDLLDVGTGLGGFLNCAKENGWRLSGIELSNSAFAVCQKRFGSIASLQQTSFERNNFPPASFDCIVMLNVIEHVYDPLETCKRAFELLRPGGCLALRWPQFVLMREMDAPAHLHGFTRRSMEILLRSCA